MTNGTGPYGQGEQPGQPGGGWPQQAQAQQAQAQQTGSGWPQQYSAQAPTQQIPVQQQVPAFQQQAPQGYAQPPMPPQQAPVAYAPQAPAPQQAGLTPNPFALPGQNPYAGYTATQGQPVPVGQPAPPVNPYGTGLGANASAQRDDQGWLDRAGLSKGKATWLAVLLVAAGGFWTYDKFFSTSPDNAKVGDCVVDDGNGYDLKTAKCSDPAANAKVVAKFDGTTDSGKCDPYATEGAHYFVQHGKNPYVLCIQPLAARGGPAPTNAG